MTNEEARAWLEHHFDPLPDGTKQSEAVSLAIKALETISKYKDAYGKGWIDGAKASYEHLKMCEEEQEPKYCDRNICIKNEYSGISCDECEVTKSQKQKTEKVIKMRDATPEERESIDKYIKSISKPTGVAFWDLEQEPKTVLYSGDGYADGYMVYDMAECPSCGYKYEGGDKDWGLPFCPNCGQKLNWESEDEE